MMNLTTREELEDLADIGWDEVTAYVNKLEMRLIELARIHAMREKVALLEVEEEEQ